MLQNLKLSASQKDWVIMADPARIKPESTPERTTSANEEHPKSEDTEDLPSTAKPTDENKESSSQDQPKQEVKSVSSGASFR